MHCCLELWCTLHPFRLLVIVKPWVVRYVQLQLLYCVQNRLVQHLYGHGHTMVLETQHV